MKRLWYPSIISVFLGILASVSVVDSKLEVSLGLLETSSGDFFCVSYLPSLNRIPSSKAEATPYPLADLTNVTQYDTCLSAGTIVKGKVPFFQKNKEISNCSVAVRASNLQAAGALAVISDGSIRDKFNASDFNISIPVVNLYEIQKLLDSNKPSETFRIYSLDMGLHFDPAIVVLFVMATSTVMLGSYLSGYFMLYNNKLKRMSESENADSTSNASQTLNPQRISTQEEEASYAITPLKVLCGVFFMSCFLVILYFFSGYIIYGLIALYVFLSIISTYYIFEPCVMWTYAKYPSLPTLYLPFPKNIEIRQIILLLLCIVPVVVWVVFRKAFWVWPLQDALGIIISLMVIRDTRLPSLKICTLLLSLLFFYDIFFVFVTPLFTKNGESIMVDVATGGDSGETFPIVLVVPRMLSMKKYCFSEYMMLGLGDIAIPGLLVGYCHCFDIVMENKWKIYWICANIGYIIGLIVTDISLLLSGAAQPALLYLVPCTLLPTFVIALLRREFKIMWSGGPFRHERI